MSVCVCVCVCARARARARICVCSDFLFFKIKNTDFIGPVVFQYIVLYMYHAIRKHVDVSQMNKRLMSHVGFVLSR